MYIGYDSDLYSIAHNTNRIQTGDLMIHAHAKYEIYYFVEGDVDFFLSGIKYPLAPHTLMLIPPNSLHGIRVCSENTYDRFTVHFSPELLSYERRSLLLDALPGGAFTPDGPFCWPHMDASGIPLFLARLEALATRGCALQKALTPIFLEALIAQLLMLLPPLENRPRTRATLHNDLLAYVNAHFTESITLDALCTQFFLSKTQINHLFRRMTGMTVIRYVNHKRLEYAQQLLMGGLSASQAATISGFGDYTTFYRAYRKHFGISPNQNKTDAPRSSLLTQTEDIPPYLSEGFTETPAEKNRHADPDGR